MPRATSEAVDAYIAAQPAAVGAILGRIRRTIREAVPGAEEIISYKIPAYRLHGSVVMYFAGWKQHVAIYPADSRVADVFADELAPYAMSKGTIRFPLSEPVPLTLIARIATYRSGEIAAQRPKEAAGR